MRSVVGRRWVVGSGRFGDRCVLPGRRLVRRVVGWWWVVGSRRLGSRGAGCWRMGGRRGAGGCLKCRGRRRCVCVRCSAGQAERAGRGDCAAADGVGKVRCKGVAALARTRAAPGWGASAWRPAVHCCSSSSPAICRRVIIRDCTSASMVACIEVCALVCHAVAVAVCAGAAWRGGR